MAQPGVGGLPAQPVETAVQEVAPWIVFLARIGFVAKALLYATVGFLAAKAALGSGGKATDTGGALREVVQAPGGGMMLYVIAAGLIGYAVWRVVDAINDAEGRGRHLKGILKRFGSAVRGLAHGALAFAAFRLASGSGGGGGGRSKEAAARAMELPGGDWLVWLAGGGVLIYAGYQLYRAYAAKLGRQLDLSDLPSGIRHWIIGVSRAGIAARGIVFGFIGVLLIRTSNQHDPGQAGGIRESLEMLAGMGRWPLGVVAFGLVGYALYELLNARYRRIRVS